MKIVSCAIRTVVDGVIHSLPRPARHHHILHAMIGLDRSLSEQGFVTSDGTFVDRPTAMEIALAAAQVKRRKGLTDYDGPELFSEDLW